MSNRLLDPTSKEPLFPLILREIGDADDGGGSGGESAAGSPFEFIGGSEHPDPFPDHSAVAAPRLAEFWSRAHELSCLRRGSLSSSVEVTYNDAMATSLDGQVCLHGEMANVSDYNRALHLDFARNVLGGSGVCCHVASDGSIANGNVVDGEARVGYRCFKAAFCMHPGSKGKSAISPGLSLANDHQMETIAQLSGRLLSSQTGNYLEEDALAPNSPGGDRIAQKGGWFQSPMSLASKVSNGVSYAIDRVLAAYDGDEDRFGRTHLEGASEADEFDDALHRNTSSGDLDDAADDALAAVKGTVRQDRALGNADEVISLTVVASCCRLVLESLQTQSTDEGANDHHLFLRGHQGGIERVMLHRSGWDACSFGWLCRQAGKKCAEDVPECAETIGVERAKRLADILSQMSQKGVDLLAVTLCKANYAIIEKDVVTLFPGGIPSGFEPCQTDGALFQIHITKVAIQNRMSRLERDADAAKANAVRAQKSNTTKLALVHMRRRKAALDEVERCAAILTNLDAAELRLERAKGDVQIVQSYKMLKAALRDVRQSSDAGGEDVEELMLDLREEMEGAGAIGEDAAVANVVFDEDELNEELERLELECEGEQSADKAGEKGTDPKTDQRLETAAEPRVDREDPTASKAEAAVPV